MRFGERSWWFGNPTLSRVRQDVAISPLVMQRWVLAHQEENLLVGFNGQETNDMAFVWSNLFFGSGSNRTLTPVGASGDWKTGVLSAPIPSFYVPFPRVLK